MNFKVFFLISTFWLRSHWDKTYFLANGVFGFERGIRANPTRNKQTKTDPG